MFTARILPLFLLLISCTACIGDDVVADFVEPQIRITNPISEIEAGTTYQFAASFINNVGMEEAVSPEWSSSDPEVLSVSSSGLASAVREGSAEVTVAFTDEFGDTAQEAYPVMVGASTVVVEEPTSRSGRVNTTTFYVLRGDFTLEKVADEENSDLRLSFGADYVADDGLPGLYVYLTNNPNTTTGALEVGRVTVFRGAHEYIISGADLNQYSHVLYFCKPFNVKVGDGRIDE